MLGEVQYRRIARLLRAKIEAGEYAVGTRIPGERELATLYGVSRITTRHAIADLVQRGLLVRRQGRGTFVATRRVEPFLLGHFSFSEALRAQGLLTSTRVLAQRTELAAPAVAAELQVLAGAALAHLVRLRRVDGDLFAVERTWLPLGRLPGIDTVDFERHALYDVLRERYGVHPSRARETFEPVVLGAEDARTLGSKKGTAALLLVRTTYDEDDRPIEVAHALIRGDRCRVLVELWANRMSQAATIVAG